MEAFGEPIQYNGADHRAIPSMEVVELPGYDQVVETRMTISVLVGEYPPIKPGALVHVGGKDYRVDYQLPGREDERVMIKLVLR
ncbi:hypothetical protein BG841_10280 [Marinobacter sp. X15-166B]|nr:hypothetical protein BG841_10280 [Marinobacter sp. X15-166B]